jgi:hypothetical protein
LTGSVIFRIILWLTSSDVSTDFRNFPPMSPTISNPGRPTNSGTSWKVILANSINPQAELDATPRRSAKWRRWSLAGGSQHCSWYAVGICRPTRTPGILAKHAVVPGIAVQALEEALPDSQIGQTLQKAYPAVRRGLPVALADGLLSVMTEEGPQQSKEKTQCFPGLCRRGPARIDHRKQQAVNSKA